MITKQEAMTAQRFHHAFLTNADGTPLRARRNGRTQTWKTRPDDFRIPCKVGMYQRIQITPRNAREWSVAE